VLLLLASVAAVAQSGVFLPASATWAMKEKEPLTRTLTGHVSSQAGTPVADAVVYLTNSQTMAVKTFIVGPDGTYRFPALSPNVDYQVFAEYKNSKSDTKTLSSFDSRANAVINLKVDAK
jgi:hypothetical protein